jgi:uncharacterized protein YecE (DUF72 family)
MNCLVKIGTSGYSYEDWIGPVYPPDLPKSEWLKFYATLFNAVEINFTYYSLPNPYTFANMERKTQNDFEFIVKMNQIITHQLEKDDQALQTMKNSVQPLVEKEKFGGFLIQFPYRFKYSRPGAQHIEWIVEKLKEYPLFFEFRHNSWIREDVFHFLKRNNLHYVVVDEPRLKGLPKPVIRVSGDIAYFRFHGRNEAKWWDGNNQERYDYLYSDEELEKWFQDISKILKITYKTFIFFNNHPQGKAVTNAKKMKELIGSIL